jgi:cell division protein FtsB
MSKQFFYKTYSKLFIATMIMMMVAIYCAYHLVQGPNGLVVSKRLATHHIQLEAELSDLAQERKQLEQRVSQLRSNSLDKDMLEQQALFFLGPKNKQQIQLSSQ